MPIRLKSISPHTHLLRPAVVRRGQRIRRVGRRSPGLRLRTAGPADRRRPPGRAGIRRNGAEVPVARIAG